MTPDVKPLLTDETLEPWSQTKANKYILETGLYIAILFCLNKMFL